MKKLLLAIGLMIGAADAACHAQGLQLINGRPYVGPGDVTPGANLWIGTRCYSSLYARTRGKMVQLRRSSDSVTTDILCTPSGAMDVNAAMSFCSGTTCFVAKAYDQTGNGNTGAEVTGANQPQLIFGKLGSQPCMFFNGGQDLSFTGSVIAQPISVSYVAQRSGTFSSVNTLFYFFNGGGISTTFTTSPNTLGMYANFATVTATAADSAFHSIQEVVNGASSTFNVDGTASGSLNPGAGGATSPTWTIGNGGANPLTGYICEAGMWTSALSTGTQSQLNANQHAFWGF